MSVSFSRQSRHFSSRSSSSGSVSGGASLRCAPSVYGGAGGFGTRISESAFSSGSMAPFSSGSMDPFSSGSMTSYSESTINNEKGTMQNLNNRLAVYLEKVRSLEAANMKLELQIREVYEKRVASVAHDFTGHFATITGLRAQIMQRYSENQRLVLQVDNARLAGDDFRMKHEMELNMCLMLEADVSRIRGVRDELNLNTSDLEMQIQSLQEELVSTKITQQEDLRQLRIQQTGTVHVEMDSTESVDLAVVLEEMREQYEAVVVKNKQELQKWFQSQVDTLQSQMVSYSQEVKTFDTELSELKRTKQSLEISHQSTISEYQCLKQNLEEVKVQYSVQLSHLQQTINMMEAELQQLRVSVEQQQSDYKMLLDIKTRLEMEIAEYRRLLDGEHKKAVIITKVIQVEEHKPLVQRRVKTIVEEIVDGRVVSSTVDTQVEAVH
ncbi:keratin, type I cytoskeletal 20-like [Pseudoliparis swirei]|uniref:keratin, type I cytoskeletal 20-like n=1 Tax=Pseudoliparis swirei TaxID=2059687 RepID=UPI0024BDE48D|nr:keratin, type I cytoskeletal 20-like [Pseudoliparis swirei]